MSQTPQPVVLSDENKRELLSEANEAVLSRQPEVDAILARLKELNSELADEFEPKKDALADLTLRMLFPEPPKSPPPVGSIPDASPGLGPSSDSSPGAGTGPHAGSLSGRVPVSSFIIVSYCWHYPSWKLAPAATPIQAGWEISRRMVSAIAALRISPHEGVWLDRLCINQSDAAEKQVAIGAMDAIYKSARLLVILLEDVQLDEEEQLAGLTYSGFFADMVKSIRERKLEGEEKGTFMNGYFAEREGQVGGEPAELQKIKAAARRFAMKMLGSRWYTRAWCAHESRVVPRVRPRRDGNDHGSVPDREPIFLCFSASDDVLTFEFRFIFFLSMKLSENDPDPPTDYRTYLVDPAAPTLRQRWYRILRLLPELEGMGSVSALQHLVSIVNFGCAKQEDLVSISLNTAGIPLFFRGTLAAREDVLWVFAALVLASGDPLPLLGDGIKLRVLDDAGRRIVSWMDDPSGVVLDSRPDGLSAESVTGVTREYVELDLLLFVGTPTKPSDGAMEKAAKIITRHGLAALEEARVASDGGLTKTAMGGVRGQLERLRDDGIFTTASPGPLPVFLQTFLALGIDSGIEWIRNFPDIMSAESEDWLHGVIGNTADAGCVAAATDLLAELGIVAGSDTDDGSDNNSNNIGGKDSEQANAYLVPAVKFLTSIVDTRMRFLTISPRRLPSANGDSALTAVASNRSYVAVPACLARLPMYQKRGWLVEPFDPLHDPPEKPSDHLPDLTRPVGPDAKVEDVCPVLTSDFADRRAAVRKGDDDLGGGGTWRLRRRQEVFGCGPLVPDGEALVLRRRQRVYGAEDYDWMQIHAVIAEYAASQQQAAEHQAAQG